MTLEPDTRALGHITGRRLGGLLFAMVVTTTVAGSWPPILAAEVDAVGVNAPTGFAEVIERVRPAVVGVRVKTDGRVQPDDIQFGAPPPGSPLDRFFRQFGIVPENPAPKGGVSLGSGFFVSSDGFIVTNNHVIAGGKSFEVTTDDGKVYQAKVVGADPQTDLALIKIASQIDLPYVGFAKAEPKIGDWVLPIGNPFGLGGTVTAGIVSARGRDIGEGPYNDFIQIDAPVNKGNSGGPTFNVRGEVIGVNTAIYSPSGGSVGVAFDIPAETVKLVVEQLKSKGHVTRGSIGVQLQTVTPMIAEAIGLKKAEGALVAQVEANGPAAKHGIEAGDVITSVDDQNVKEPREFARTIGGIMPGTSVKLGLVRNGRARSVVVKLGEMSTTVPKADEQIALGEKSALGLTVAPARSVPGMGEGGVVITGINPETAAAASGLQIGDIVLSVAGQLVNAPTEVERIVNEARDHSKRAILIQFKRDQMSGFVALPVG
ncbi:MAG: Do family serine endopeptidase [Bradyrhizobium sp.]|nr:Do family serine endopeptidase [Bradyrhizobium sp.]